MYKITTISTILILALSIFSPINILSAQGALFEIPMSTQVSKSELVIEGKVIAQESFWNIERTNIFTKNTVEVYKVFKGEIQNQVVIITKGGWVDNQGEEVHPSLQLRKNDTGLFMLYKTKTKFSNENSSLKNYNPYSGSQAFYKYNPSANKAKTVFKSYNDIEGEFYNNITSKTKIPFTEIVKKNFSTKTQSKSQGIKALAVTGVSPSTISAGTKSELTITGTDFGATQGKIYFQDADEVSGQIEALTSQITSWEDTEIIVEVPSDAGTGSIQVETSGGFKSPISGFASITIPYAELGYESSGVEYQSQHVDRTGSGGMEWQMTTPFDANTAAKESFLRAFESWRCTTKINWTLGTITSTDSQSRNGENVIRFDTDGDLEAGTLGVCYTYPSTCNQIGIGFKFFVDELDIVFNDGIDWEYGPALAAGSKYDFETVAVHELGHGHQLGHVIDPSAIMHRSIGSGQNNRALSANDIAGGNDVQSRSTTIDIGCSEGLTTNYSGNCSLSVSESELNSLITIFPNPSKGKFYISNDSSINLESLVIYDINGRLISKYNLSNTTKKQTINLTGISKGIYFSKIHSDTGVSRKKIVIE